MIKEINGWHVLGAFVVGFGIIIGVNLTLAFKAVQTFPGLEVKNSYVASQQFQQNRSDQVALGWDVAATVSGDELRLEILQDGRAIAPQIEKAVFGRATHDNADQTPVFEFDGTALVAPVEAGPGNWNLRLTALADNGTVFQQRVIVEVIE
ncbi:MAG: FixH family protein [Paracoccaceae bacterium]